MFDKNVLIRNEMQAMLNLITDGVIGTDNTGIITMLNKKAEETLRIEEKGLYGQRIDEVFNEKDISFEEEFTMID